jgi:hypothetical protein
MCGTSARADHLDGILQAMAPTAPGMVSRRCSSPVLSFEKTVTGSLDGYKNGYNQRFRQNIKRCKVK